MSTIFEEQFHKGHSFLRDSFLMFSETIPKGTLYSIHLAWVNRRHFWSKICIFIYYTGFPLPQLVNIYYSDLRDFDLRDKIFARINRVKRGLPVVLYIFYSGPRNPHFNFLPKSLIKTKLTRLKNS